MESLDYGIRSNPVFKQDFTPCRFGKGYYVNKAHRNSSTQNHRLPVPQGSRFVLHVYRPKVEIQTEIPGKTLHKMMGMVGSR